MLILALFQYNNNMIHSWGKLTEAVITKRYKAKYNDSRVMILSWDKRTEAPITKQTQANYMILS